MRFRAFIAALLIATPLTGYAQQAPINPANLPAPLPTKGIIDTGGISTTGASAYSIGGTTVFNQGLGASGPTLIGPGAGAALTAGTADSGGGFFAGYFAGHAATSGQEVKFVGYQAGRYSNLQNSGYTFVGDETVGYGTGNDRDKPCLLRRR